MTLVMLGFWAAVGWVVVTLIRDNNRHRGSWTHRESPTATAERILAERYAGGEIDAAEYHQRLDDIRRQQETA
jgi:uncharacterized membrane protein